MQIVHTTLSITYSSCAALKWYAGYSWSRASLWYHTIFLKASVKERQHWRRSITPSHNIVYKRSVSRRKTRHHVVMEVRAAASYLSSTVQSLFPTHTRAQTHISTIDLSQLLSRNSKATGLGNHKVFEQSQNGPRTQHARYLSCNKDGSPATHLWYLNTWIVQQVQ